MKLVRLVLAIGVSCVFAAPAWAQKPSPGGSMKKDNDPQSQGQEKKGEEEQFVYTDKEFNFTWTVPEALRKKYWHLEVPERKSNNRVVKLIHAIGAKKDLVFLVLEAIDSKLSNKSDKDWFEKIKFNLEDSFSEVAKNETKEKDKFQSFQSISVKMNGRDKNDKTEIWDRQAHVFKKGGTIFIFTLQGESGMLEKYKAEIDEVIKSLKIK